MEGSTRIGKIGLAGYPGYIFLQKIRYGYGQQRYDEKRTILHNWYSALRAYLPVLYKADEESDYYQKKKQEYETVLEPLLKDVSQEINAARTMYEPYFEDPDRYDPIEKDYETLLDGIKERLDVITAITHIIDKGQVDDDEMQEPMG